MAITPPSWSKNAVPTPQGWRDPRTNELLKAQKLSESQINEYLGVKEVKQPVVEEAPKPEPVQLNEAPSNNTPLDRMTKAELEALGREHGVELDRRKAKADLVEELKEVISE
jgi:hypothetical protein